MIRYKSNDNKVMFCTTAIADNLPEKYYITSANLGRKRVCVKYLNSTTKYGFTTDTTASDYSPSIHVNESDYYFAQVTTTALPKELVPVASYTYIKSIETFESDIITYTSSGNFIGTTTLNYDMMGRPITSAFTISDVNGSKYDIIASNGNVSISIGYINCTIYNPGARIMNDLGYGTLYTASCTSINSINFTKFTRARSLMTSSYFLYSNRKSISETNIYNKLMTIAYANYGYKASSSLSLLSITNFNSTSSITSKTIKVGASFSYIARSLTKFKSTTELIEYSCSNGYYYYAPIHSSYFTYTALGSLYSLEKTDSYINTLYNFDYSISISTLVDLTTSKINFWGTSNKTGGGYSNYSSLSSSTSGVSNINSSTSFTSTVAYYNSYASASIQALSVFEYMPEIAKCNDDKCRISGNYIYHKIRDFQEVNNNYLNPDIKFDPPANEKQILVEYRSSELSYNTTGINLNYAINEVPKISSTITGTFSFVNSLSLLKNSTWLNSGSYNNNTFNSYNSGTYTTSAQTFITVSFSRTLNLNSVIGEYTQYNSSNLSIHWTRDNCYMWIYVNNYISNNINV